MAKFRYLPHTADMKFRSYGRSFREALENSAAALINVMLDADSINGEQSAPSRSIAINEEAHSETDLVWFTLQDILSAIDSRKLNAISFKADYIKRLGKGRMKLSGRLICSSSKKDHSLLSVKAITPHGLNISRRKGTVSIDVVADV